MLTFIKDTILYTTSGIIITGLLNRSTNYVLNRKQKESQNKLIKIGYHYKKGKNVTLFNCYTFSLIKHMVFSIPLIKLNEEMDRPKTLLITFSLIYAIYNIVNYNKFRKKKKMIKIMMLSFFNGIFFGYIALQKNVLFAMHCNALHNYFYNYFYKQEFK